MEALLERQWEQGSQFLMSKGGEFDVAQLLSCLHQLKSENQRLEEQLSQVWGNSLVQLLISAESSARTLIGVESTALRPSWYDTVLCHVVLVLLPPHNIVCNLVARLSDDVVHTALLVIRANASLIGVSASLPSRTVVLGGLNDADG